MKQWLKFMFVIILIIPFIVSAEEVEDEVEVKEVAKVEEKPTKVAPKKSTKQPAKKTTKKSTK